ncbi:mRNA capping enzyme, beta chain, putative [Angomonas deanei]|uniref:mRNA 5'-phosphatase n=1 Tax=Angomonas deanei TaxID=59799 RepID=A0A7G2CD09_9TRYP|nr:mRNA capping enzyme, beta chain, putative [Angomonas deanei]
MLTNSDIDALALSVYTRIEKHLSVDHLEFELRLCLYKSALIQTLAKKKKTVVPVSTQQLKGNMTVGVSEPHFLRLKEQLEAQTAEEETRPDGAKRAKLETSGSLIRSYKVLEDVFCNNNRYTYLIEKEAGKEVKTLQEVINKKRLTCDDFYVSQLPYGIRINLNEERLRDSTATTPAPPPPPLDDSKGPTGFTRKKERFTFTDKDSCLCFDLTKVTTNNKSVSYEVEVEGMFTNPKEQLNKEWIRATVERVSEWLSVLREEEDK